MVMNSNRSYRSLVTVVRGHPIQLDSPLTIPFAVARASQAAEGGLASACEG